MVAVPNPAKHSAQQLRRLEVHSAFSRELTQIASNSTVSTTQRAGRILDLCQRHIAALEALGELTPSIERSLDAVMSGALDELQGMARENGQALVRLAARYEPPPQLSVLPYDDHVSLPRLPRYRNHAPLTVGEKFRNWWLDDRL